METNAAQTGPMWPLILYFGIILLLVLGMLGLSFVLGERHRQPATDTPFESGMPPTGDARLRFPANFYLIGMFFVIFDLETVFVVAWAVAAKELGWVGYGVIALFIGTLLAALVYLWRIGALDWGASSHTAAPARVEGSAHAAD